LAADRRRGVMLTIEPAGAVLADTMTISSIKFGG
jgi:hypothetical protein